MLSRERLAAGAFPAMVLSLYLQGCGSAPPSPGSFYRPPAGRPTGVPGDLIRSEPLSGAPPGASAWRVLYISTDLDGRPAEVSGIVIAPDLPPPVGGRPVVAWAHPTTGVADDCAPSLWKDVFDTIPHLPALMALDYVVAATDYPGLGTPGVHPYLVGVSEGRGVLDSVRAARGLPKAGAGARFAVWGHSQGGHAALFAGQLAKSYAPELTLAGVVAIAPATELAQLLRDDLSERAGRLLGAYCLWSWSRVYGVPLETIVAAPEIPIIDRIAGDCIESEGEGLRAAFATLPLRADFLSSDAYGTEPWSRLLAENRPGQSPIGAPIYVVQGMDDPVVRPSVTADFVKGLCRSGEIVRFEQIPNLAHARAGHATASSAILWMDDRFSGKPPPNTCAAR